MAQHKPEEIINKTFRLYDEVIWLAGIGLLVLTYHSLASSNAIAQMPGVLLTWIIVLLKTHRIHVRDGQTIIFQGLFRQIVVKPQEIREFQEWIRGARIVYKGGSIILWPYIENQDQFKNILKTMNPNIVFRDIAEEGTRTSARIAIIMICVFIYFGWLIWSMFNGITKSFK